MLKVKCGQYKASLAWFISNPPRIEFPMDSPQGLCRVDCINTPDIMDDALLVRSEEILADTMAGHISEESGHQK